MIHHHDPSAAGAPMPFKGRMSYSDYLHLEETLAAQEPLSIAHDETLFILHLEETLAAEEPLATAHDEMLFAIQHETSELWMKLALHEIGSAIRSIRADRLEASFRMLARVARIFEQLDSAWDVLTTVTPNEYPEFRRSFGDASGFQSWQYRAIEFMAGNRNLATLRPNARRLQLGERLDAILAEPSLYDEVILLLARNGFDVGADARRTEWRQTRTESDEVLAAWETVHRDPHRYRMLHELAEKLIDFEDRFRRWRFNHVAALEHIIGPKLGAGGAEGVSYLKKMLEIELFPELWKVRARF